MVIKFNHIGCGMGGVLINDGHIWVGVVCVPGAVQEKLEPMRSWPGEEGRSAGVKLLQGGQDDHGEAAAASHCLQLQQEGL